MLDHFNSPRNSGTLTAPTAEGRQGSPGQGNYMVIQLRLAGERIVEAAFQTYGCPGAIACGSAVTELVKGRTVEEARQIGRADVDSFLGGLPLGKGHCADLAAGALQDALAKVMAA
jgi:NifU-like protein involved in Fe-S cluster formation